MWHFVIISILLLLIYSFQSFFIQSISSLYYITAVIEHLEECPKLHTLILQDNVIDTINNIEWNRELWNIDLSGNRVIDK